MKQHGIFLTYLIQYPDTPQKKMEWLLAVNWW
jgi:hypothetical protein